VFVVQCIVRYIHMFYVYALVFMFGASLGSFVNVLIDRVPAGRSIWIDRSACDFCHHELRWYELIPFISYVLQRGKCRSCGHSLSITYAVMEFLTACLVTLFVLSTPLPYEQIVLLQLVFILILLAIAIVDLKSYLIPQQFIYALIVIFCLWYVGEGLMQFAHNGFQFTWFVTWISEMLHHVVTATLASGFFYALVVITKGKGMGGGDVQLAFVMGLYLTGMQTLIAVYSAFVIGALFGLLLIVSGKRKFGQVIPFGPFLALGSYLALIYGSQLLQFYLTVITFQ